MAKSFLPQIPANGPPWLPTFANSIADLFRRILPAPLRPPQYATADLPDAAIWAGAVVYNLTAKRHYYSDGTSWIELAARSDLGTAAAQSYSSGSWLPELKFGGAATGITYANQAGQYVQFGHLSFVSGAIILTSKGSATGPATITGLPFTVAGNAPGLFDDESNMSGLGGAPYVTANGTTLYLRTHGAAAYADMSNSNFTNTSQFNFSAVYSA